MKSEIETAILSVCHEIGEESNIREMIHANAETKLYGDAGCLDSIGLVFFISAVEEKIGETFGKDIVLADEKAMSQRVSPFLSVNTLTDYIQGLLNN